MSLIMCEGCDDGLQVQRWTQNFGGVVQSGGRLSNCIRLNDNGAYMQRRLEASQEDVTIIFGGAVKGASVNSFIPSSFFNNPTLGFYSDNGATLHVSIIFEGGNTIVAHRGDRSGPVLASATVSNWVANNWYFMEALATLDDTAGRVAVKLNGTTVFDVTGLDTKNGGTKTVFDAFRVGHQYGNNDGNHLYWDDMYLLNGAGTVNNNFLGDISVETLLPNGDGSSSQWVGSDGDSVNNYLLVDEATPDTTDYVQAGAAGLRDLYAMTDLAATSGPVYGVITSAYARASANAGVPVKPAIKSAGTVATGAAVTQTTSWWPVFGVFELDPATSAAWAISAINAMEVGVEVG